MTGDACEVVTTREGARAILDRTTMEVMHPVVGPLVESERLYVTPSRLAARLREPDASPLVLYDVGLGAGSNAVAAWKVAHAVAGRRLAIVSFDRTTAAMALALDADAAAFGFTPEAAAAARALLAHGAHETDRVAWRLVLGELPGPLDDASLPPADVVFWDPFSPRANPSLWTMTAFAALRARCREGATVHTYSAATSVRSALLLAGFAVGVGDGVDAKPTTVAATSHRDLARPLDARWLDRLRRSSAPFPVDAPPDARERIAARPQF